MHPSALGGEGPRSRCVCPVAFLLSLLLVSPIGAAESFAVGSASDVNWTVTNSNRSLGLLPATVPGCAHTDLLAAGVISEPNFGLNHELQRWIASDNFSYATGPFALPPALLARANIDLVLRVDTAAVVEVNGVAVAAVANMHRVWVLDVRDLLVKSYANATVLRVHFTGPVPASLAAQAACVHSFGPLCPFANCTCPAPWPGPSPNPLLINAFLRKEQQSFSWDFAPATGTSGLLQVPEMVAYDGALLRDVIVDTQPSDAAGAWVVNVAVRLTGTRGPAPGSESALAVASIAGASASANVTLRAGEVVMHLSVPVSNVSLWSPNGYGGQSLYNLTVTLTTATGEAQSRVVRVGFRTIALVQAPVPGDDKAGDGRLFTLVVNGQAIYARGSNWVPNQSLGVRSTREELKRSFAAFRAAHFTTLRVWGGGVYASDDLLSLADEAGIIILQDFQFGDQFYAVDAPFLVDVAEEVRDAAWRLGSHPSLGLYYGSNEMASGYSDGHHFFNAAPFYGALYFTTIAGNLSAVDPSRVFLSSTPSQGNESAAAPLNQHSSVELRGDMHYYNLDSPDCWNVSALPRARFITEHGWESWPSLLTLAPTLAGPQDYGFNASVPASRQMHPPGQGQITNNVESNWRWPSAGADAAERYRLELWMTQVAAGACLRASIEFWRGTSDELVNASYALSPRGYALLGKNSGVLYWQADDTWPGPSWSTLELGGRPKVGFYESARAFAPLLVAGHLVTSGTAPFGVETRIYFSSSTYNALPSGSSTLTISSLLWSGGATGAPLQVAVSLPAPHSSSLIFSAPLQVLLDATGCPARNQCVLTLSVSDDASGALLSSNWLYLSPFNQVTTLRGDPGLSIASVVAGSQPLEFIVELTTSVVPVPAVWLETPLLGRFSDNGFLLTAPRTLLTFFADGAGITPQQLRDSLQVWSLADASDTYSS